MCAQFDCRSGCSRQMITDDSVVKGSLEYKTILYQQKSGRRSTQ